MSLVKVFDLTFQLADACDQWGGGPSIWVKQQANRFAHVHSASQPAGKPLHGVERHIVQPVELVDNDLLDEAVNFERWWLAFIVHPAIGFFDQVSAKQRIRGCRAADAELIDNGR